VEENAAWGRRVLTFEQRRKLCGVEEEIEKQDMRKDVERDEELAFANSLRRDRRKAMWERLREERVKAAEARKAVENKPNPDTWRRGHDELETKLCAIRMKNAMDAANKWHWRSSLLTRPGGCKMETRIGSQAKSANR